MSPMNASDSLGWSQTTESTAEQRTATTPSTSELTEPQLEMLRVPQFGRSGLHAAFDLEHPERGGRGYEKLCEAYHRDDTSTKARQLIPATLMQAKEEDPRLMQEAIDKITREVQDWDAMTQIDRQTVKSQYGLGACEDEIAVGILRSCARPKRPPRVGMTLTGLGRKIYSINTAEQVHRDLWEHCQDMSSTSASALRGPLHTSIMLWCPKPYQEEQWTLLNMTQSTSPSEAREAEENHREWKQETVTVSALNPSTFPPPSNRFAGLEPSTQPWDSTSTLEVATGADSNGADEATGEASIIGDDDTIADEEESAQLTGRLGRLLQRIRTMRLRSRNGTHLSR
ncbi:hypothetical protein IAU59_003941 [Kwoniella sp. CBS 9459]